MTTTAGNAHGGGLEIDSVRLNNVSTGDLTPAMREMLVAHAARLTGSEPGNVSVTGFKDVQDVRRPAARLSEAWR